MNPMLSMHSVNVLFTSLVFGNCIAMYFAGLTIVEWLHQRAYARRLANLSSVTLKLEPKEDTSLQPDRAIFRSRSKALSQRIALQSTFGARRVATPVAMLARSERFQPYRFDEAA